MSLLTLFQLNLTRSLPVVLPEHAFVAGERVRNFTAGERTRSFTASVRKRDFIAGD